MDAKSITDACFSDQLRYFTVLYKLRSYADAARAISMSYQGLRKSIDSFELALKMPLFSKSADGSLIPTKQADLLYERTIDWYEGAHSLSSDIAVTLGGRIPVDLALSTGTFGLFGEGLLEEFESCQQAFCLNCYEYPDFVVDRLLSSGEFNLAVTVAPFDPAFETTVLAEIPFVAWVNRQHKLANEESLAIQDLEGETFVCNDMNEKASETFKELFAQSNIQPAKIVSHSEIVRTLIAVLKNEGIGMGIGLFDDVLSLHTDVVPLSVDWLQPWTVGLSTRKGHVFGEAERALVDYLVSRVRPNYAVNGICLGAYSPSS